MNLLLLLALILLAAETPTATPTDRAYLLVGNWHCETYAGSKATRTYTKVANEPAINSTNTVRLPNGFYVVMREHYVYDVATGSWAVDSPESALWGAMHASAEPWSEKQWIFTGIGALPGSKGRMLSQPIRMIYTALGENAFRRSHQIKGEQLWRNYSEEVCTRDE